jgi:uncharacterized membrane protein
MSKKKDLLFNKKANRNIVHSTIEFSGPLPPPQMLEKYDQVSPGAAAIIIAMVQKQQEHRMSLEKQVIDSDVSRSRQGLYAGWSTAVLFALCATYLVSIGKSIEGTVLGTSIIVALVSIFVRGSTERSKEREVRDKPTTDT